MNLIFEQSRPGVGQIYFPMAQAAGTRAASDVLPKGLLRETPPELPSLSELEVVRHVMALSRRQRS
jgi:glycine dehydrogenase subunit 2